MLRSFRFSYRPWSIFALLALLLAGCGSAAARSGAVSITAPLVHLPADQANHPKDANEWWYVVGHVHAGTHTFGYEVTVFRLSHLRPPGFSAPIKLFRTDIAITDETSHRFLQHVSYYFPQSASVSSGSLTVRVGSAVLTGSSPRHMTLKASLPDGKLSVRLSSRRPPMYVGGRGYLPFGNSFTYYYSLTDLATTGSITERGATYPVSGISWLDHQWGNWAWTSIRGWTWMALQLSNGVQLSVFDFRGSKARVRAASVLLAGGKLRTIRSATISASGSWTSPHTGATYPDRWVVRIPPLHATLHIVPTVHDQEVVSPGQKAASYWEGSGRVQGTFNGKAVTGLSYTELTGFAAGLAG